MAILLLPAYITLHHVILASVSNIVRSHWQHQWEFGNNHQYDVYPIKMQSYTTNTRLHDVPQTNSSIPSVETNNITNISNNLNNNNQFSIRYLINIPANNDQSSIESSLYPPWYKYNAELLQWCALSAFSNIQSVKVDQVDPQAHCLLSSPSLATAAAVSAASASSSLETTTHNQMYPDWYSRLMNPSITTYNSLNIL